MASRKNKLIKRIITFGLILVVLGIILYPKFKPVFTAEPDEGPIGVSRSYGARGGGQPLLATGYVIVPTQMNELIYSTG
ncbi:MAG: hypothetical protein JW801_07155, partial [Bacteroidales bacterium]|nr:hypothetical protein [Bacteroidales bacterium]